MILNAINKSIEFLLDSAPAANQLPASVSFADHTSSALVPGSSDVLSNGITAVTLVAAPVAATQRQIKSIHIYNADTSPRTVTVRLNSGGTTRILVKADLEIGDSLVYEWGRGWFRGSTLLAGFSAGIGSVKSALQSVAAAGLLDIQPPSGESWSIHNIYHDGDVELYFYDGTNSLLFDSATGVGVYAKFAFNVTNSIRIRVKNIAASAKLIGYDGRRIA